jgi:hypothetical protein
LALGLAELISLRLSFAIVIWLRQGMADLDPARALRERAL